MASDVSAIFTSMTACDEGKLPDTQAMFTPSTSSVSSTMPAKHGYTQMVATCGRSGYCSSKALTRLVNSMTLTSLSVVLRVVSSMLPMRNFFTSRVSFCGTFSAMMVRTASATALSSTLRSYLLNASVYLSYLGAAAAWLSCGVLIFLIVICMCLY